MSTFTGLPRRVDPRRLASARGVVEGEVPLADLDRLTEHLLTEETPGTGSARLRLSFAEDDQRRIVMTGRLQASLRLQCQRCLNPVEWPVDTALRLIAVADDEAAAQVPRGFDPVVVGSDGLDPAALVEDELILALPVVARCDDEACRQRFETKRGPERADKPFAVLAGWKAGRNEDGD